MRANSSQIVDPIDHLPAMAVGRWVTEEKHEIIRRYVHASYAARRKWRNRTYVDLFSGPGRVFVRHTGTFADGGCLAALKISQTYDGKFSHFFLADASYEYLDAVQTRFSKENLAPQIYHGRADSTIDLILKDLPKDALHLVLLDPFNAGNLHFSIIQKLSALSHIDVVVHLSTGDIQRNIGNGLRHKQSPLDDFAPDWRRHISAHHSKAQLRREFLTYWLDLVRETGFTVCDSMYAVRNSKGSTMYHLCLLTKHSLANKLWTDACKIADTRALF